MINYFKFNGKLDEILSKDDNIFKNKNINIQKYSFVTDSSFSFVFKSATNEKKVKENLHETFVGLTCINDLLKKIPNFSYVFGTDDKNRLITEHIDGKIFLEYIKSDEFNIDEYVFILLQICLTLHVAQSHCGFIHYDLTTWNIIIQRLENEVDIDYVIDDKIITVRTNIIPILIDYGKSSVIHNFEQHFFVNMYNYSTCQDIISILVTSLYQILVDKNITKTEFNDILKIANFLSKTGYRRNTFFNSRDLKSFLRNAKKYSNILNDNKYELEKIKPMDLFKFLTEKFNKIRSRYTFKNLINLSSFMDKSNPEQIFYYSLAENNKDIINSYISTLKSLKKSSFHDVNLLVNDLYKRYGKESYKSLVKNVLTNASKHTKKENEDIEKELDKFKYRKIIYDENIFTEPEKLLKIFENNIDIIENIHKFKILDKYNDKLIMFVGINTLIQTTKIMYSKEKLENVYNFIYKIQL